MELRRRETGESFELVDGMVFGRLANCDAKVDDGSISRRHAKIEQKGRAFELVDMASSNGIFQNGSRKERFLLRPGDLVTMGAVAFDVIGNAPETEVVPAPSLRAREESSAQEAPASSISATERARARLRREVADDGRSRGFGDLGQQPMGIQLLVFALGIAVMYGVVEGIRLLASSL